MCIKEWVIEQLLPSSKLLTISLKEKDNELSLQIQYYIHSNTTLDLYFNNGNCLAIKIDTLENE